jgi:multicomponent Na+:H+ antiporter subunit F
MINSPISFALGLEILITILTISTGLCFLRLYLGPTVPNRTAAFDTIAIHAVAILALYAIRINAPSILDVAIITAVLGFLGTTIMARYLERTAPRYYALQRDRVNNIANKGSNRRSDTSTKNDQSPQPADRSKPNSP